MLTTSRMLITASRWLLHILRESERFFFCPPTSPNSTSAVDEAEGVSKFLGDAAAQWKNLALEVRSVRSMLEEVISNWEKYGGTVAALQAWLEDAEHMLNQSEAAKRVSVLAAWKRAPVC